MSNEDLAAQMNALLQRVQGLEMHVSQIREVLKEQSRLCLELAQNGQGLPPAVGDALRQLAWKGESVAALTPDVIESAQRQFSEEQIVAGLREVRGTGGLELSDFIHELEEAAGPDK